MTAEVPLFSQREALEPLLPEIAERQRAVLERGQYVLGPELEAFESEFASYVGGGHCVGVGSGTDAIAIGLRALGVGPGDEVVVPAFTFYATAEAIATVGATPVFCDVDPAGWCMSAETAEPVISDRTRVLIPVHLFGNPAPMAALMDLARSSGVRVLEDCAQAHGAKFEGAMVGSLGDAAAFSFFPAKNLGGFGDGGAVTTDDEEVAEAARRLRRHGTDDGRLFTEVGYNSRLDEIQAAGLRVALRHLPTWTERRREIARSYLGEGIDRLCEVQSEPAGGESCRHLFVVATGEPDVISAALRDARIETRRYYEVPLHRQPGLARWAPPVPLPECERLAAQTLALPIGPGMAPGDVERVVRALRAGLAAVRAGD